LRLTIRGVLVLAALLFVPTIVRSEESVSKPTLILVSLDGFRWDYLDLFETPNLNQLAAEGVRAKGLTPVYPSKTFPSHYSIVTGLYPGHHGIFSNNMFDPKMKAEFHLSDRAAVGDRRWWWGEPIWVTAERQGVVAATLFWPGSEAAIEGIRPSFWHRYDGNMPFEDRVERALDWLDLPLSERPRFIALYFQNPNDISHVHGPVAPETVAAIREVDARVGDLRAGIEELGLSDRTNLMIVSDHGMAEVSPERVIYLEDHVQLLEGELFEDGALLQIYPRRGRKNKILRALRGAHPKLTVYSRKEIPRRYELSRNRRVPPILGIPEVGWEVTHRGSERDLALKDGSLKGDHGQDPADPRMQGILIAVGPAFRAGAVIDRVNSVDLYEVMASVLGLKPAPNDGDPNMPRQILLDQ
jgi:predicted AlkP superfamily pyrophosphatase or phosphodiesterase